MCVYKLGKEAGVKNVGTGHCSRCRTGVQPIQSQINGTKKKSYFLFISLFNKDKNSSSTMTAGTVSAQNSEDIAFARALHGNKIKSGLLANLSSKNADVHNVATDTYLKMWKQPENETKEDEDKRLDGYTSLVNSYYNLATDFYEYGKEGKGILSI